MLNNVEISSEEITEEVEKTLVENEIKNIDLVSFHLFLLACLLSDI
jgi:hypothetical protein